VGYSAGGAKDGTIAELTLVLPDPERAAKARDAVYGVTVVGKDGRRGAADFATAVTLTFLREALGVPLTQAGVFYGRLLAGEAAVDFAGARVRFTSRPHPKEQGEELHGLSCALLA
jgi:hypothetical protein